MNFRLFLEYGEYYDYAIKERRNITEILFDFQEVIIPLKIFVNFIGFQKPREYSISSSLKCHPGQVNLTVALVEYETKLNSKMSLKT